MKNKKTFEKHEREYGPHFNEECALKVVSHMENEDGTKGAHWSLEQAVSIASQYNISLNSEHFNKYDWYVALNMVYSDFYKAIISIANSDSVRYFVELAKAWLKDKDVEEGKMWYYYKYVMCDELRDTERNYDYEDYDEDEYDDYYRYRHPRSKHLSRHSYPYDEDFEDERFMRKSPAYDRRRYLSKYY